MILRRLRSWFGSDGYSALGDEVAREKVRAFEDRIGYRFVKPLLVCGALTHRSYFNVAGGALPESNERLEFLGDSVLELVVNDFLYHRYPEHQEGDLTKMKSLLVSRSVLSLVAAELGLGAYLLLSDAERVSGGEERASILADGFEAVIGAVYLDGGLRAASRFIERFLLGRSEDILDSSDHINYKSILQENVQERHKTYPRYHTTSEDGPDHSKEFTVEVRVRGKVLGVGKGTNKKAAEQAAAQEALAGLGIDPTSDTPHS